jgi:hypothetical protein
LVIEYWSLRFIWNLVLGIWDFKSREQQVNTMITESSFKAMRYALCHRVADNKAHQDKAKKASYG